MNIPNDPVMLLSYINTKLRDDYPNLNTLCDDLNIDRDRLCEKLAAIGYRYDRKQNRFG